MEYNATKQRMRKLFIEKFLIGKDLQDILLSEKKSKEQNGVYPMLLFMYKREKKKILISTFVKSL